LCRRRCHREDHSRGYTGQAKHAPDASHYPGQRRSLAPPGCRLITFAAQSARRTRSIVIIAAAQTAGSRLIGETLVSIFVRRVRRPLRVGSAGHFENLSALGAAYLRLVPTRFQLGSA
jgi:hypothetical protein